MVVTVGEVAQWLNGVVVGDDSLVLTAAKALNDAASGDLTFIENEKYLPKWIESQASAVVTHKDIKVPEGKTAILVDDPLGGFADAVLRFRGRRYSPPSWSIDSTARIHPTANIAHDVSIDPYCIVGAHTTIQHGCKLHTGVVVGEYCQLGANVQIYPNVVIYNDCEIGDRSVIHSGAVIGADGFGYRTISGKHHKVPQVGGVVIGSDVEIGACSTIDRGTFSPTIIGEGTKIDNLVQIAHNCRIGKHNIIVSQVGIAGSSQTGDYVIIAGQVGIADHITIGDDVQIGARSGVVKDIPSHARMLGEPAMPDREYMKVVLVLERLPAMRRDLQLIKRKLSMEES